MSLNAYIWAADLPLDIVGPTAFRVLLKYADRVDQRGRVAWYTSSELAESLGCSLRTVQRALRELLDAGLIIEGDQRFVKHLRGDRRPTVYDLNLSAVVPSRLPIEAPDDTTPDVVSHDTTNLSRYDNGRSNDTTTVVAHRTVIEPLITTTSVTTEGGAVVAPSRPPFGVQPAPRYPRFEPATRRSAPEPRTPEEETAVELVSALRCPQGFGTGKNSMHWFPGVLTGCARCGVEALELASQIITTEEVAP